jgi:hypothetical protein
MDCLSSWFEYQRQQHRETIFRCSLYTQVVFRLQGDDQVAHVPFWLNPRFYQLHMYHLADMLRSVWADVHTAGVARLYMGWEHDFGDDLVDFDPEIF